VRWQRGFTLLEVVFAVAIFGIFLFMLASLTAEMRGHDRRYPVNFMRHPQVISVISRMRRDVLDATLYDAGTSPPQKTPMYPVSIGGYSQSPKTLILYTIQPSGFGETVVWDFSVTGEVRRKAYSVGAMTSEWVARGLPSNFTIGTWEIPDRPYAVRVQARDQTGKLAIDQIFQPRAHE
jgi:prepilin-type N-terminal cleavage/methylation domain-containing protein